MEGSFSASRRIKKMRHVSRGDRHREQCKGIILELGTSLGLSTLALALGASDRQVVTVEGSGALADMAGENLKRHDVENVSVMNCEFSEALERIRAEGKQVVLAFIDGNHRGTALIKYIGEIAEMGEDMIIVADDIHLTKDMYHAWKTVVRSSIATATMETFRFGILFRIRGLTPGDYRIRC
jgi:predicted O-methyltransferase YrrM